MPQPTSVTVTGVATSAWIPMDYFRNPFNVGLGVTITGTATYTVQHTFENPNNPENTTPTRIFDHETLDDATVNDDGNYAFPVAAIRLDVTASTGSVTLDIIQAGIRGG
jgi:hypothetical protein